MNVRFAEDCRKNPLEFVGAEWDVFAANSRDGRTQREATLTCDKDIFIGVFFDGTNNNKYRDTPGFSHSNVARLYEVFPGTPARQTAPKFKPKVNSDGSTAERTPFPDKPFKATSVPAEDFPYHRKIYVPGVGTPMPDVGDTGLGRQRTGGLATALLGQVRLDWALLQLINQIHAAVFQTTLEPSVDMTAIYKRGHSKSVLPQWSPLFGLGASAMQTIQDEVQAQWRQLERTIGSYDPAAFDALLDTYMQRLTAALKRRGDNKPHLRKIRLSVFGFSRGAAEARAWVNMVTNRWGTALAGIELQIDFLGLFDTVASVGLAQSTPHFDGHAAWASDAFMPVPAVVKRCVHLVAALEVRGSFPLDSVCQGGMLPSNCKEIVYPGVHSDVGGGYPPDDQGRALGPGAAGDKLKLSQISLAQMYREARMAGVPLAPEGAMIDDQKVNFAIDAKLREDFNAYIAATRSGTVAPTNGKGEASYARMFPTETQPREELFRLMRRHYGFLLRWRKAMLNRSGGIAGVPGLKKSRTDSRFQDIEDFRGAEEELRKEVVFLQSTDPKKFDNVDDLLLESVLQKVNTVSDVTGLIPIPLAKVISVLSWGAAWGTKYSLREVMQDKQRQWDTWLHEEWASHAPNALPQAAEQLFEHYVHDSRAWFKPFMRTDLKSMVPDDEEWFTFGGRDKERKTRTDAANAVIAQARKVGDKAALALAEKELAMLKQDGQPLMFGGREPYRMWGYLRHRRIYQSGKLRDSGYQSRQQAIEIEEAERIRQKRREDLISAENQRHTAELAKIRATTKAGLASGKVTDRTRGEYLDGARLQEESENRFHAERLKDIEAMTSSPAN